MLTNAMGAPCGVATLLSAGRISTPRWVAGVDTTVHLREAAGNKAAVRQDKEGVAVRVRKTSSILKHEQRTSDLHRRSGLIVPAPLRWSGSDVLSLIPKVGKTNQARACRCFFDAYR